MNIVFSSKLLKDVTDSVRSALSTSGIVNIAAVAESVRSRNAAENVALEDITARVMEQAQLLSAAMEFDGRR